MIYCYGRVADRGVHYRASVLAILCMLAPIARADAADESWEIHGQVVDEQGKPVEDFEAATFWVRAMRSYKPAGTDEVLPRARRLSRPLRDPGQLQHCTRAGPLDRGLRGLRRPRRTDCRKSLGRQALACQELIDGEGKTSGIYGIQRWPTVLLIDPEGHLVKHGNETILAERLKANKP